ncbi:serine hydrolase domain-containing protein [Tessaracoccus terricola]
MAMSPSSPSAEGVDARGLLRLLDALETPGHGLHSLMIARHGKVIAEGWWSPYERGRVHLGYSLSKSFTSTVLGHLVGEGVISLDAPVWSYLSDLDSVPERWRRVTVRHCISMTVGHSEDAWDWRGDDEPPRSDDDGDDELLSLILEREPDGEPGEVWAYNQVGTYLVAQAIAAATGEPVSAHVRRLLLDPFGGAPAKAQRTHQGRDLGFSGLHVTTPSILALAQTWLDGGVWEGRRIVPVDYATEAPIPTAASMAGGAGDWERGYGYSFWNQRHGYRGDGAFGQFAVVLPEHDTVVAITSETVDMASVLDLLWEHLIPAMDGTSYPGADAELADRLAKLQHVPLGGSERRSSLTLPLAASSQLPPAFAEVTLEPSDDGHVMTLAHPDGGLVTRIGDGRWVESIWPAPGGLEVVVAASGAWRDGCFDAELRLAETPHTILVHLDPGTGAARLVWRQIPLTGPHPLKTAAHPF